MLLTLPFENFIEKSHSERKTAALLAIVGRGFEIGSPLSMAGKNDARNLLIESVNLDIIRPKRQCISAVLVTICRSRLRVKRRPDGSEMGLPLYPCERTSSGRAVRP